MLDERRGFGAYLGTLFQVGCVLERDEKGAVYGHCIGGSKQIPSSTPKKNYTPISKKLWSTHIICIVLNAVQVYYNKQIDMQLVCVPYWIVPCESFA